MNGGPLVRLAEVARALGELREQIVFIGGAIAPLLQMDRPFAAARATHDVHALAVPGSYAAFDQLADSLRARGFAEDLHGRHAHRWTSPGPNRIPLDVIPIESYIGSVDSRLDALAAASSVDAEIEPGLIIRHVSAPAFLAQKFAAFRDRGQEDPYGSEDLEDVFALLASRPGIVREVADAPSGIRSSIVAATGQLIATEELQDLLAGHLGNVARANAGAVVRSAETRLRALAGL